MKLELRNEDLKTLVATLNSLMQQGFTEDYKVNDKGLKSIQNEKIYLPHEVKVLAFYRFEGSSDPADNSILYAIETKDGKRGTLVDAFGPYGDSKVASFMKEVDDTTPKNRNGIDL